MYKGLFSSCLLLMSMCTWAQEQVSDASIINERSNAQMLEKKIEQQSASEIIASNKVQEELSTPVLVSPAVTVVTEQIIRVAALNKVVDAEPAEAVLNIQVQQTAEVVNPARFELAQASLTADTDTAAQAATEAPDATTETVIATGTVAVEVDATTMVDSAPILEYDFKDERDPYERLNRKVFIVNDVLDRFTLKPIAQVYKFILPQPVDKGISNVFSNLGEVNTMVNSLLQGKFKNGAYSMIRLLVNSTLGVVGIFDVATRVGIVVDKENFAQTLGVWGVGKGPYLILPLLGPSTVRATLGIVPTIYLSPVTYLEQLSARDPIYILGLIDGRTSLLDVEKLIIGDRYIFIRDFYLKKIDEDTLGVTLPAIQQQDDFIDEGLE